MGLPLPAPMLATLGPAPAGEGWAFEFKWDGVRALARVEPGGAVLVKSRSGRDITPTYPELRALAAKVPAPVVLDGELVVLDDAGRPSFRLHQNRMQVRVPGPPCSRGGRSGSTCSTFSTAATRRCSTGRTSSGAPCWRTCCRRRRCGCRPGTST